MNHVVVVGAGHAGTQFAASLRQSGFDGAITIISEEDELPYQRPPLSKGFMADANASTLPLQSERFYADKEVELLLGTRVDRIEREARTVVLADGKSLPYDHLVLATGLSNRTLGIPGESLEGVHSLRTSREARDLSIALDTADHAVVVGAGFIGLEFVSAAQERHVDVTVVEYGERPMARILSPAMSREFSEYHRRNGVHLCFGDSVASVHGDARGRVAGVRTMSGTDLAADMVLVSVGTRPNTGLAVAAGLAVDNGIVVDETLRTSDAHISAIGDCANYPNAHTGTRTRLESVQNATGHAKHLANVLVGADNPYRDVPWFWTMQGRYKLQIAGVSGTGDDCVKRETGPDKFSIFCFNNGRLSAVESLNHPIDHMAARRILSSALPLSQAQARDPSFDLKGYSRQTPG